MRRPVHGGRRQLQEDKENEAPSTSTSTSEQSSATASCEETSYEELVQLLQVEMSKEM